MTALKPSWGLEAPLFERLVDREPFVPTEPRPRRALSRDELRESIHTEVARLLNTRCAYSLDDLVGRERTVLEYGLPDLSNYYAGNEEDYVVLVGAIREAIEAFEPRLKEVQVEIGALDMRHQTLTVAIAGKMGSEAFIEPVRFTVVVHEFEGRELEAMEDARTNA